MKYAILSDLHSHYKNTKKVLKHIKEVAPSAEIIGLGDLFECTIGKKKAKSIRNAKLKDAAIIDEKFLNLLTFPSIIGNQEERIALVTGDKRFLQYEAVRIIEHATLIHGHQIDWGMRVKDTAVLTIYNPTNSNRYNPATSKRELNAVCILNRYYPPVEELENTVKNNYNELGDEYLKRIDGQHNLTFNLKRLPY